MHEHPRHPRHPRHRAAPILFMALATTLLSITAAADVPPTQPAPSAPQRSSDLFQPAKVWTAHLRFTPEQWAAMEPKQGGTWTKVFTGGQPAAAGQDLAASLASAMLKRGDRDRDGRLSRSEFLSLADTWFTWCDDGKAGRIDAAQIQAGLNLVLDPEGLAQPGSFPLFLRGAPGQRNGLASAVGIEFKQVHADLDFQGTPFNDIGIRYKGNGTFMDSRGTLKRSLKLEFNQFVKAQKLTGLSKLNLHNNVADPSFMNESLSYRLYRDAGVPSPRTSYVKVYVTVPSRYNRMYFGVYSIIENVDNDFAKDRFGTAKGAIFKPVTPSLFADLGPDWSDYQQIYDPKTPLSPEQVRRVIEFSALLTHADDAEFASRLGDYLDLDQFARYMAVTTWLATMDSILMTGQNYYVYLHPRTNKFRFIPWDLDHSFGQIFGELPDLANLSIHKPWGGPNRFLERVFKVEAFKTIYLAHLNEFGRTIFKPERFHQQVDEIAAAIRPAIVAEPQQRLAQFDKTVAGGPIKKAGFFAPRPVASIKGFADARTASVLDQLAGKTQGQPPKGLGGWGGRRGPTPGASLAPGFIAAMHIGKDGKLTRAQFLAGFDRWFKSWATAPDAALTLEQLRAGMEKDLAPAPQSTTKPASR